jgi:hypothetical protein
MRDLIGITYDGVSGGPELTAAEWRQVETGLFVRDTNDLVLGGVRGGSVSNTAFSVTIAPLTAVVQTTAALGVYQAAFPAGAAELAKTINAAHATLPRVDAIDVKIFDHEADASTFRGADIQYNAGTANASPVAPTFAGVGFRLGTFAVPASGGGNPVWTANPALNGYAASGGILDVVTTRPASPRTPTVIFNRATGCLEIWNGTAWVTPPSGLAPVTDSDDTDVSTTSTSFVAGSPAFGVTFVAPPSGKVYLTLTAYFGQTTNQKEAIVSEAVRTGGTIGSGSLVGSGANGNRALVCGEAVNASAPARMQASRRRLVTGLTAGSTYNARVEMATTSGGGCEVYYRELLVEPVL